jgi:cobalt-zinc-cadmium efflux system protein
VTVAFLAVEVVGGLVSGSLALIADAGHMFTDVAALLLAYAAMTLAEREATPRYSFGLYRAEILAAFVNAELLLLLSGYILYEAFQRISEPPEIRTGIMLGVAAAGLVANLVSMRLLHADRGESLNVKAAYLEVMTDTLGSLGVIVAAGVMAFTSWYWLDPLVSAGIGLVIVPRAVSLLRQSAHILLEGTPGEIDVASLRDRILAIPGVEEVHDLHFWTLTSGMHSASVHIRAGADCPREEILKAVQGVLREHAAVDHATVQVESVSEAACPVSATHA